MSIMGKIGLALLNIAVWVLCITMNDGDITGAVLISAFTLPVIFVSEKDMKRSRRGR